MNDVGAVKIPAYNFHDPALWFTMCDSTFQLGCLKAITDSKTKFNYIIAHLPPEAATIIRDVIMNPDLVEPYEKARMELIKRSGESSHQEIWKLLIGELGDRRPSELLRVMRRRAESHSVPDDLMLELFQQHLPTRVQSILAAISPLTLEKAAKVADRVMEVTPIAVSACSVSSDKNSIESPVLEEIKKLNLRIDEISRSRSRSRNRNLPFHKRNRCKSKTYEQCWYHYKFGSAAQKCHPPCKFSKKRVRLAAHLLAPLNKFLEGIKNFKKSKKVSCKNLRDSIQWTEEAEQAFNDAKNALADATLLRHPIPGAKLSLWTDASDKAVSGSLMQLCQNNWEHVAFLSVKLSKSQQKWSTYDRELLAMYISVKRFRHMLEGRDFIIYTDQKPLITDVRHINGTRNAVADALSRIEVNQISNSFLDFKALSKAQLEDNELQSFQNDEKSSLVFKRVPSPVSATELICDTSTGSPRPFVPHNFRRTIFEHFHNLAHPGVAASFQLIASRYVWPNMRKTVKDWVQNCIACQRSKVHRHTKTPLGTFALPDARFSHIHVDLIGPLPSSEGKSFA
ncbi:transposon Tf2-11 polyprotein [Trichonephila clavipes]|nr:transposon Tf2-11 polyprotein [Trichonephila clavipes]